MSDAQPEGLDGAIRGAVNAFTADVVKSMELPALQELACSGTADGFADTWQVVPSYRNLAMVLTHDSRIRTLLKQQTSEAPVLYSFLFGSPLWAMKLPAGLIAASCFDLLAADVLPTHEAVAKAILSNVRRLRLIAAGRDVDCAFVVGLDGLVLPPSLKVVTKLGVIREAGNLGHALTFFHTRQAAVVLCGRFPMRIRVLEAGTAPDEEPAFENIERAGRSALLARLAVILADSGLGEPLRPRTAIQIVTAPYIGFMGGMTMPQLDAHPFPRSEPLADSEIAALQTWIDLLTTRPVDRIAIAIERIVTASTERTRVEDVLIDSVTAWESLVGAEVETQFRVTASLTHLLEAEPAKRAALHAELKKIYGDRSKVVHGETRSSAAVRGSGDRALGVAKEALAVILKDAPWLLELKSSSERSAAILLDLPPGIRSTQDA